MPAPSYHSRVSLEIGRLKNLQLQIPDVAGMTENSICTSESHALLPIDPQQHVARFRSSAPYLGRI
jgi:hypothetical protein